MPQQCFFRTFARARARTHTHKKGHIKMFGNPAAPQSPCGVRCSSQRVIHLGERKRDILGSYS